MRRAQSASSEPEESSDVAMQEELERLRNDLRIHMNDKYKYDEEVKVKMNKLNEERCHLERDNCELKTYLDQAESEQNKKSDDRNLRKLQDTIGKYDNTAETIEEEKQHINSLDAEIRKYDRMNRNLQKLKENSSSASKDIDITEVKKGVDKKTLSLENQMDKQLKKYNDTLTVNSKLREDIEKLRNERIIYSGVYKQLFEELEKLREEIKDRTEQATFAYDQRDDANNKCISLKEKNDKDRVQHGMEMRDLQRIIEHEEVLRTFMNIKSDDRFEWKKEGEERRRKHGSYGEIAQKQQRKQIMTYDSAFTRIKQITEKEDINILVADFIRNEDDNFALFQYVSELNDQIENLNEDIANIKLEIEKFQNEEDKLETERHKILKDLELEYNSKKADADRAQTRLKEVNKILEQVREGVKSIFRKINCDDSVILDLLGGDSDISDRNLMLYLGSVEQRTNALLSVAYYIQTKQFQDSVRDDAPQHGMTLGLTHATKPTKALNIRAPAIGDDFDYNSDDSVENIRPLSQHELYAKAMKDMNKHDNASSDKVDRHYGEMKRKKAIKEA